MYFADDDNTYDIRLFLEVSFYFSFFKVNFPKYLFSILMRKIDLLVFLTNEMSEKLSKPIFFSFHCRNLLHS